VSGLPSTARALAALAGSAPAVVDGATTWTWAELDASADAVAFRLAAAGLRPGGRVALLGRASAPAIALLHGVGRVGAVVVPLNDRLAPAELAAFVEDVDVSFIVAGAELGDVAGGLGPVVLSLVELVRPRPLGSPVPVSVKPDAPAVIIGTSGTTGRAKGAVLTWGAIAASAEAWNWFLPPSTGWLSSLSIAHVGGLGIVWRAALAGVPVVIPSGTALAAQVGAPGVSHISLVAVQLARLLDQTDDAPPPDGLRAVLLGGGPIPPSLVLRALAAGWPVVPTYGMTETASGVTALATAEAAARPASAGRPLTGAQIRIADGPPDGVGEIEVRGPSLFAGYYGKPAETAAVRGPDGWFRTGDLGSIDADGYLTVSDRRLDLIVSGGENVYPAEVEAVLLGHPAVLDACVVGRPDARWGAVPVAAIVLRTGATPADDELRAYCAGRLARFKVPAAILRVAELPRVGAGKLDRRMLREMAATAVVPARQAGAYQAMPPVQYLDRPGGMRLAYRLIDGPAADSPVVLLLHSTLSSGWQLTGLARAIAEWSTVVVPDRRGSGASRLAAPRPVGLDEQVADLVALLRALRLGPVTVFGHSYGGVVALALAAAHPHLVSQVVAYEPPLLEMLSPAELGDMADVAAVVRAAHASGGAPAAAEAFLQAIGGEDVLTNASTSGRAALLAEGDGVLADVGSMTGARVDLAAITCPVTLVTGDASEPFYAVIADCAAEVLQAARREHLPEAGHPAPITQPAVLAELLRTGTGPQSARAANRTASPRSNRPS
jgi:O-succinylbenzoic acid--CoA ligase